MTTDIRTAWQQQAPPLIRMSPAELRQKARRLQRTIQWRNLREYAGAAIVVVIFSYYIWKFPWPLVRLGAALTIAGALYMAYQLHKRGSAKYLPVDMALNTCLDFHRKELERQRDALREVWSWYLLPFVPGLGVFQLGLAAARAAATAGHVGLVAIYFCISGTVCALCFFGVWELNQWAARKLQLQIDELAAVEKEPK